MITQLEIKLVPSDKLVLKPEYSYRLYGYLLHHLPQKFGAQVHENVVSPINHYLEIGKQEATWHINLIGDMAESTVIPFLKRTTQYELSPGEVLRVQSMKGKCLDSIESIKESFQQDYSLFTLYFQSATAFKVNGAYVNIPSASLLLNNLAHKWLSFFPQYPLPFLEDGKADSLAEKVQIRNFRLKNEYFHFKGTTINGFTGYLDIENKNTDYERMVVNFLLNFSPYVGVGIKTTIGMGGTKLITKF